MLETSHERIGFLKAGIPIELIEKLYVVYNQLKEEQRIKLSCSSVEVNI